MQRLLSYMCINATQKRNGVVLITNVDWSKNGNTSYIRLIVNIIMSNSANI